MDACFAGILSTSHDVTTIHDETDGLQSTPPDLDQDNPENDDNDIAVASLPTVLSDRLTVPGADSSEAIGAALSGSDGTFAEDETPTSADVLTVSVNDSAPPSNS